MLSLANQRLKFIRASTLDCTAVVHANEWTQSIPHFCMRCLVWYVAFSPCLSSGSKYSAIVVGRKRVYECRVLGTAIMLTRDLWRNAPVCWVCNRRVSRDMQAILLWLIPGVLACWWNYAWKGHSIWKNCQLELRPVLLGSPSTVVTRQFIRLHVTISILVVTTGFAGGISAEKSGLELGPCFDTDAWREFKLWQL